MQDRVGVCELYLCRNSSVSAALYPALNSAQDDLLKGSKRSQFLLDLKKYLPSKVWKMNFRTLGLLAAV